MTAQSVVQAFKAEGLDAMRYGVVGHDQWEASEAVEEDGIEISPAIVAGERYSLRPDELWAFIAAGFEARLSGLEGAEVRKPRPSVEAETTSPRICPCTVRP